MSLAGMNRPTPEEIHAHFAAQSLGTIVNETDFSDEYVKVYVEEHASVLGISQQASFNSYRNAGGSLLARSKFHVPRTVAEEIVLARDLADRDDDISATIGSMLSLAFSEGFQHVHPDETVVAIYDEIAKKKNSDIRAKLAEVYRELLIASQVTTVTAHVHRALQFAPQGADRQRTRQLQIPLIGVIPAEQIRVLGNDMFGTGAVGFMPATGTQEAWLDEYFTASPERKAEMRRVDPVLTTLLVGRQEVNFNEQMATMWGGDMQDPPIGTWVYLMNPAMTTRSTFAKGAQRYPRPLLTSNFALLEAKRLLNVMDHALLESGANFLVVVKKGTDQRPATNPEVANLQEQLKRSARSGVIVGDHRLSVEVITPDLNELLNPDKRRLLGRKLSARLLRIPAAFPDGGGAEEVAADLEILSRVVTDDRAMISAHVEDGAYDDTAKRNGSSIPDSPFLWFPKIILQGTQFFTDLVLKLRDRGDIPRQYAVEAAGFNYKAGVEARKREKANGDDKILTPAPVPFNADGTPQDQGGGRPKGGSPDNGAPGAKPSRSTKDPARPSKVVHKNAGETVRAFQEGEEIHRAGELTHALLEEYADTATVGRITRFERNALERIEEGATAPLAEGPLTIVPVNVEEELSDCRAVRLTTGLSLITGTRYDGALMTRGLIFRSPEFAELDAEERALRWGFYRPTED